MVLLLTSPLVVGEVHQSPTFAVEKPFKGHDERYIKWLFMMIIIVVVNPVFSNRHREDLSCRGITGVLFRPFAEFC